MLTPGLFPDPVERRTAPLRAILGLAFAVLAAATIWAFVHLGRRTAERDRLTDVAAELAAARAELAPLREARSKLPALEKRLRDLEAESARPGPVETPPPPPPAPELRVLPIELSLERLTQGLQDFRSVRYAQAESAFLKAVPESWLYLVLSALARGEFREATLFLVRTMAADRDWLRRVRPRDLFGTAEEYARVLRSVEDRVAEDPLDPDAKLLLAYLHFHEKGPDYAKALVVEVGTAKPDHAGAKSFREALER